MESCMIASLLVLFASIGTISSQRLICPVNSQSFISVSRSLLPLDNVHSTSEGKFNPTPNFLNRGDEESPWCTAPNLTTVAGQYVELNFTEPVVVGLLMSGGFVSTYVNNFTVHYTMSNNDDDYVTYGSLNPTQDFLVPDIRSANVNFVLGEQIIAKRLKFVVNDGMVNQQHAVCWKMLLYGCTMNQAQEFIEAVQERTEAPTGTDSLPTTNGASTTTASQAMLCSGFREESSTSLLLVVLPVIIALVLIVIIIVAILLCICFMRAHNQKKLEYNPARQEMRDGRTKSSIENGTTTPSSVNFHYDNPRFLCYDVPRTSIRSRQNSESMSTLGGSMAEVRNPVYAAKRSLQDYRSPSPTYHIPPGDDANDYEDIPGTPKTSELDKRTVSNTSANSPTKPAPAILTDPPKLYGLGGSLDGPQSPTNVHNVHYSKVNKLRSKEKDEMEQDTSPSPPPPPPPVINSPHESANNVLVQEIDQLVNDLENSRAIAKQW